MFGSRPRLLFPNRLVVITEQASNHFSQGAESAALRVRTLGSSDEIDIMTGRGDGRLFRPYVPSDEEPQPVQS